MCLAARAKLPTDLCRSRDGVLSSSWHEPNQFPLRGVGLTGVVRFLEGRLPDTQRPGSAQHPETWRPSVPRTWRGSWIFLSQGGHHRRSRPALSKVMDTTEGVHRPLTAGNIFNNLNFSKHDPWSRRWRGPYRTRPNPTTARGVIVTVPVEYEGISSPPGSCLGPVPERRTATAVNPLL